MHPLNTIVVGVDFTPCSAAALREAMRLAAPGNARVHAVHIVDTQIPLELQAALTQMQQDVRKGLMADAQGRWKEFIIQVPEAAGVELEVGIEHRVLGLLAWAKETDADLLILGAFGHQHPAVGAGTVATTCVRNASTDVLLVRDTHRGAYSIIVAGVDFSETSRRAMERAAQIAAHDQARLHIVHVYSPPWDRYHYRAPTSGADPNFMERYKSLLGQKLHEFVQPVMAAFPDLSIQYELSDAGRHRSGLVEFAERVGANLICLGSRGQSNLRDFFLGSTAEKVLSNSKCSVLTVKPPQNSSPASR